MQVLWSGIKSCFRKYAFTCQHHILIGFRYNIIKHTIFYGQVKVGVGQVKVESHLPYYSLSDSSLAITFATFL